MQAKQHIGWQSVLWLLLLAAALPLLTIAYLAVVGNFAAWPHLLGSVLPPLLTTTVLLCLGCGLLTAIIGTFSAWLVATHDFPGRNVLKWMALLPLAMPGYIISFVYVDLLTFAGPVQTWLRLLFGWNRPQDYWFPDIRSLAGAMLVLSFALYPYVYMAAWAAFVKQPMNQLSVARTLGRTPFRAFWEITLPQARPALLVGVLLVVVECLNDIGAATFFGIRTLTIAIYSTWLDEGNLAGASQLALLLLSAIGAILFFERMMRRHDGLARHAVAGFSLQLSSLRGMPAVAAFLALLVPIFLGFLLPLLLLVLHGLRRVNELVDAEALRAMWHSFSLSVLVAFCTLLMALMMIFANRVLPSRRQQGLTRLASMGYGLPGTVLGIGILVPFGQFDQWLNRMVGPWGYAPGLVLSGGVFALVFAYVTRFLIIAVGNLEDGMERIPPHLDHVARTLGRTALQSFFGVHLPLLRPSLVAAALLVFVDAMKELPVTLILRPFDFETLSTRVFSLSSLGQFESAALPALAIVLAGLVPVMLLSRSLRDGARLDAATSTLFDRPHEP